MKMNKLIVKYFPRIKLKPKGIKFCIIYNFLENFKVSLISVVIAMYLDLYIIIHLESEVPLISETT